MKPTEPVNGGPHGDPDRAGDFADNQWLALQLQDDDLRPALMERAAHEKVMPFCSADHPLDDPDAWAVTWRAHKRKLAERQAKEGKTG